MVTGGPEIGLLFEVMLFAFLWSRKVHAFMARGSVLQVVYLLQESGKWTGFPRKV